MKNFMKKWGIWLLAAVILVGAVTLGGRNGAVPNSDPTDPKANTATGTVDQTPANDNGIVALDDEEVNEDGEGSDAVQELIPEAPIPTVKDPLSWDDINAFPIKTSDMSIDEARQLCVDFFKFSKLAAWTPDVTVKYIRNASGSHDSMSKGTIYGGFPYVGVASGSVYRMMEFIDENGVVDMQKALGDHADLSQELTMYNLKYFGNQCSIGAWWGWARVINSAKYLWTQTVHTGRGFVKVGDFEGGETEWNATNNRTTDCLANNGTEKMFACYAQLHKGDCMVYYTSAGHVIMASSDPVVVRLSDGTVDGDNSYIYITDQAQKRYEYTNDAGDTLLYESGVDSKRTFQQLFDGNYVPYTFEEFLGTDPIEETQVSFSHSGATITKSQLFEASVSANYSISDTYVIVTDQSGNEVYRHMVMAANAGDNDMRIRETNEGYELSAKCVRTWGKLESGTYNVEVEVQLGTGERPTVYVGTLIV